MVKQLSHTICAGNIYVNRTKIGAVVGAAFFGGEGLSGTGPKPVGLIICHVCAWSAQFRLILQRREEMQRCYLYQKRMIHDIANHRIDAVLIFRGASVLSTAALYTRQSLLVAYMDGYDLWARGALVLFPMQPVSVRWVMSGIIFFCFSWDCI